MATTELHKVPETILSRCQVFEFRTISTRGIFDQLRRIAEELGIQVSDRALMSIARAGEGSMRDAESALDQVISFAGSNVADEDVSTALGLVDTETLANLAGAIARQDSGQVLRLADEVVARGYNLRNLCKELMVFFRGLLVTKVAGFDPELVQMPAEEADSFIRLADSFSEQDLIRFFSILAKTEQDIKESLQPRFHMEIGLMKLVHASRLYLLEDALAKLGEIQTSIPRGVTPSSPPSTGARSQPVRDPFLPSRGSLPARLPSSSSPAPRPRPAAANAGSRVSPPADMASKKASSVDPAPEPPPILEEPYQVEQEPRIAHSNTGGQREVENILNKLETQRKSMLLSVLDHAVSIRVDGNLLRVTFQPTDTTFRSRLEARDARKTLEETAREVLGREITLSVTAGSDTAPPAAASTQEATAAKDKAEEHPAVRSLLDAFHGEVIEVIKPE
jgi:DNA polymerase-3 subunit gamma/tau